MNKKIIIIGFVVFLLLSITVVYAQDLEMLIDAPSYVEEDEFFNVIITDVLGLPVVDANVTLGEGGQVYRTSSLGSVSIQAPLVDEDTTYLIRASKSGYVSAEVTIQVNDSYVPPPKELLISGPSSVDEGDDFLVFVGEPGGDPVLGVKIIFNSKTYYTGSNGEVSLNAPEIDSNTSYLISASKEGYISSNVSILVLNKEIIQPPVEGWIYGIVYGKVGNDTVPLEDAMVCVILSKVNNVITSRSVFTNETGEYNISVQNGTYSMEVSKTEYIKSTIEGIEVRANQVTRINFMLQKDENESKSGTEKLIDIAIEKGKIEGEITITDGTKHVTYHGDTTLSVEDVTILEGNVFSFTVDRNETSGTIIFVRYDTSIFDNSESFEVKIDGVSIKKTPDFGEFLFGVKNESTFWTDYNGNIGLYVHQFSEHTITISSISEVIEAIGGIAAVILYVVIAVVVAIVFVGTGEIIKRI